MKTIRFLAVLCAAAVLPALADVEALYWQVTSGSEGSNPDGVSFQSAALHYDDGAGGSGYLPNGSSTGSEWVAPSNQDGTETAMNAAILGETGIDRSGWSFYIELQNYDSSKGGWYTAGRSDTFTYAQASTALTTSSSLNMTSPVAMTPSVAIPEPTSGVLMLVGGMLLALRRRRV